MMTKRLKSAHVLDGGRWVMIMMKCWPCVDGTYPCGNEASRKHSC
jgi:hypothetical protein